MNKENQLKLARIEIVNAIERLNEKGVCTQQIFLGCVSMLFRFGLFHCEDEGDLKEEISNAWKIALKKHKEDPST